MRSMAKLGGVVGIVALAFGSVASAASDSSKPKRSVTGVGSANTATSTVTPLKVSCVLDRSIEFSNDIQLFNIGSVAIPAGRTVQYQTAKRGPLLAQHGTYTLVAPLEPGQNTWINDAIPPSLPTQIKCTAKVLPK